MEWAIFLLAVVWGFYRHKRDKVEEKILSGDQDLARDIRDDNDWLTDPADYKPPKI
jgi:hypothetical protein